MRQGPTESATQFRVGTRKRGNDGNQWIIAVNYEGVHRWQKQSTKKKTTQKKKRRQQQPLPPPPPSSSNKEPVTYLRGLWRPLKKPLRKMSREELVRDLQKFRDVYEKLTERNQDLSDDRLADESVTKLRNLLTFYYSDEQKLYAENWVRETKS